MQVIVDIQEDNIDTASCRLICELSDDGFSYLAKEEETNTVVAMAVYHFNTHLHGAGGVVFQKIFEDNALLHANFKKIFVIYSLPESVLIPFSLYNSKHNTELLNMMHGDLSGQNAVQTDMLLEHKVYNSYRIPADLLTVVRNKFPGAEVFHQSSVLVKNLTGQGARLSVIFYPQKIVVMVESEGRLLLINSFSYRIPEDVSYALLNICHQFNIEHIPVEVSGLIEKDSGLFKEVYKYFEEVTFSTLPEGVGIGPKMEAYPPHYFSHFFAVELCE